MHKDKEFNRVHEFRAWVRQQAEMRGYNPMNIHDQERLAENFNNKKNADEKDIGYGAIRQMVNPSPGRDTTQIHRDTCRLAAMALDVDFNEALMMAGYLPDDDSSHMDAMPMKRRIEYSRLSEEAKARVHRFIEFEYHDNIRSE